MREAVAAEESGSLITCRAIVKETMKYGMEDLVEHYADETDKNKQMRKVWKDNA